MNNTTIVLVFIAFSIGFCVYMCMDEKKMDENMKQNVEEFCPTLPPLKGLVHFRQFSFLPYSMKNIINLGRRGCHSAHYWDCVHKHPDLKRGDEITDKIHEDCACYSNKECHFPEMLSHSRTEPYYQYLEYA